MIRLENITKTYPMGKRELNVLRGINLEVNDGELLAIMGPSGSGKSTMLNLMGCLDKPTSGNYVLDGKEVSRLSSGELANVRGRKIGFIFQTFNLLPRLTAVANVELGMRYVGGSDRKKCIAALEKVGLGERVNHRPTELSGGEQQRVAIARAIAKRPEVLLCDEPTGALDVTTGILVLEAINRVNRELGTTTVVITHNSDIAAIADRVIHISDGRIASIDVNQTKLDPQALHW